MWKRPSDDEGTYKYIQQFLGGQVLVFIFVVEFVIANPLFFILGMSLLLRHFEVPYISRVVWLIHNSTMTSGTKFALEVQNGSINSFYDFSDGWLLAAGAGNGVEGGSRNRVLSRVRKPLPGAFELLPPRGIGKHVGRDPAISVPPPPATQPSQHKKSQYKVGPIANQEGVSQYLQPSHCLQDGVLNFVSWRHIFKLDTESWKNQLQSRCEKNVKSAHLAASKCFECIWWRNFGKRALNEVNTKWRNQNENNIENTKTSGAWLSILHLENQ